VWHFFLSFFPHSAAISRLESVFSWPEKELPAVALFQLEKNHFLNLEDFRSNQG
jgi:hypothetical protein